MESIHNAERGFDTAVNRLCAEAATAVLLQSSDDDDGKSTIRAHAQRIIFAYLESRQDEFKGACFKMSELEDILNSVAANHDPDANKTADELLSEIVVRAEVAEGRFVADFCTKMFSADYFERSNSKKVSLYHIFQSAVEAVALCEDDCSPAETLATRISRAESYLFDMPNAALFRDAVIRAFQESEFKDFSRLAEEIRKAEDAENLRRLAFRLIGPSRKVVLDAEAKRLMNVRIPPKRTQGMGIPPISRSEVSAALQAVRRRKPR
jgi:hypothetical protein